MRPLFLICLIACLWPAAPRSAAAQGLDDLSQGARDYVEGNVLGALYHELGHAMIDVLSLPVLGQEEDAADVLAVVLAHQIWQEEQARVVASATAMSFLISAGDTGEAAFWDVHGPDEQRFFNTVCLFYGADPEKRADFAADFELPQERAADCPDEFALAEASWAAFLDEVTLTADDPAGTSFVHDGAVGEDPVAMLLNDEVTDLNTRFGLPATLRVRLADCGEANAFYSPDDREITICTEYVEDLIRQAGEAEL